MPWLLLFAALLGTPADRAPRRYVTPNYGVRLALPAGLFYCPLPDGWVGTDHGPNLYLVRPDCADPAGPHIGVDYEHNVAEHDFGDGDERPARTDAELRRFECTGRAGPAVTLLGRRVVACVEAHANAVSVTAWAVYDLEPPEHPRDRGAQTLAVALSTTPRRLAADMIAFRRVAAGASACTPRWAKRTSGRPACREFPGSWW